MKKILSVENNQIWEKIHSDIFGDAIPSHCEWTDPNAIINVLNKIGKFSNSNHMFFPNGGGMDLESATTSSERGCIEIFAGLNYVLKPKMLVYENIERGLEWSYFRIETDTLAPTGIYENLPKDLYLEELLELTSGRYVNRSYWDSGEYQGEPLPNTSRLLIRILKGSLVIFKKSSLYNANSATYDGRHEKMGADGFKKHINAAYQYINESKT